MSWRKKTLVKDSGRIEQNMCIQPGNYLFKASIKTDGEGAYIGVQTSEGEPISSKMVGNQVWEIDVPIGEKEAFMHKLTDRGFIYEDIGSKIHIFHVDEKESIEALVDSPQVIRHRPATLEDVFFRLTGRSLAE